MRPVLNTIAFGGVPTGIMNAQDADRAVTISSCSAGTPIGTAAEARSGMSVAASAVLDVKLLASITSKLTPMRIAQRGSPARTPAFALII